MSPHLYRCRDCGIESAPVPSRATAEDLRALHRTALHAGLPPILGDDIDSPDESSTGWRTTAVLAGLMTLGALSMVIRWFRHL